MKDPQSGKIVGGSAIAQLKRTRHQLQDREIRTRKIVEFALDAIISINSRGEITEWNPQAVAIFGYPVDEALGASLVDLIIPAEQHAAHEQGMRHFFETGKGHIDFDPCAAPISDQTLLYPGRTLPWDPFDSVWAPSGSSTNGPFALTRK